MFKIGNVILKNNIISGPMAGISNPSFRSICIEHNAGLVVSEMISDKAICYKNKKTLEMLKVYDNEHPIAVQLFGSEVNSMVKAAKYIEENTKADILDINMGCPVNKVIKAGAGSKLMLDSTYAYNIVKAIVEAVKIPVTVKFRLGYDEDHINCVEFAKLMEKAGASAITLHARTRSQLYSGKARWEYIKMVKEAVNIPVIGNGDIKNEDDAKRMIEETNCDAVMISRASIGNPWIFENTYNYLSGANAIKPTKKERIETCLEHARRLINLDGEYLAIKQMRGLIGHYIKGFKGALKIRQNLNIINTYKDIEDVLNSL